MDNIIKHKLIILFQIEEKDHTEYVFRLSEKKNPNHFVDFKTRYRVLHKLNNEFLLEYKHNDFPIFPSKILFYPGAKLKRLENLKNYFNIIFNEYKFYKLNSVQNWIKDRFNSNNKKKQQDNNNQIFEKYYNDKENDTFLDLIMFDYVVDENIGESVKKKFNDLNFNNSYYISIPKGNDNNFEQLIGDKSIIKHENLLNEELEFYNIHLENLKFNYSRYNQK